jgi:hypothetical protein
VHHLRHLSVLCVIKLSLHGQGAVDEVEKEGEVAVCGRADERYDRTEESTSETSDDMVIRTTF